MIEAAFLLDVNVLVALADPDHLHHQLSVNWFNADSTRSWGICPLTETGFIRVTTRSKLGGLTIHEAEKLLEQMAEFPGFRFWPMIDRWNALITPFKQRVVGHQQVTDAYLLGLAIQQNGILVTLDKGLRYLAGKEHRQNLLLLTE